MKEKRKKIKNLFIKLKLFKFVVIQLYKYLKKNSYEFI